VCVQNIGSFDGKTILNIETQEASAALKALSDGKKDEKDKDDADPNALLETEVIRVSCLASWPASPLARLCARSPARPPACLPAWLVCLTLAFRTGGDCHDLDAGGSVGQGLVGEGSRGRTHGHLSCNDCQPRPFISAKVSTRVCLPSRHSSACVRFA
jgi:hypothetical protein